MGQAANIVLADGAAANVTFSPESVTPSFSVFADRATLVSNRFRRLMVRYSPPTSTRSTTRNGFEVSVPVTGVVDGITVVLYTLRAKVEYVLPDGCTDAERKDLHAFVVNGLGNALVRGSMRDIDPLY